MSEDENGKIEAFEYHLQRFVGAYPHSILAKELVEKWVLLKCQLLKNL